MLRFWSFALVVAAACFNSPPAATHTPPHDPLADARAAERGRGVPRDYAVAARIYERACDDGRGDSAACRKLFRAVVDGRGVDVDKPRVTRIATVLCERTGDRLGCVIAAFAASSRAELPADLRRALEEHRGDDCDAAHLDVCEVGIDLFDFNQSSQHEYDVVAFDERACKLDVIEMCTSLLAASKASDEQRAVAKQRLTANCDAGDADACAALPGREIPWRELCDAHDYRACVFAGCLGDPRATKLAAHHTDATCDQAVAIEQARHPPPPPPPLPPLPSDPDPGPITPSPKLPLRSLLFRQLGKNNGYGWQTYEIYNLSDRTVDGLVAVIYAYDANDTQVAKTEFPATAYGGLGLAPGAHTSLTFPASQSPPATAVAFEACYASIRFVGDTKPHLGRCPEDKKRGEIWGNGGDVVAVTVNIRSFTTYRGDYDRVVIADFERTHAGVLLSSDPTTFLMTSVPIVIAPWRPAAHDLEEAHTGPMISVPIMFTPVAVRYHLTNVPALQLSAATLAKIFQREITNWNAAAIAKDNPGVALPALPIVVVRPSGMTAVALAAYARHAGATWHVDIDKQGWPADTVYASTDDQLAQLLAGMDGAIGLTTPRDAAQTDLPAARVRNGGSAWVAPSAAGATRAAAKADVDYKHFVVNDAAAYPIVYATWVSTYSKALDRDVGGWSKTFLSYLVGDGQVVLEHLGYGVLSASAAKRARAAIATVALP